MSTREGESAVNGSKDILDEALLAGVPEAWRRPLHGVSLGAYLVVEAARMDGISETEALTWLGVSPAAFARAEGPWADRIDDALAADSAAGERPFDEVYEELLGEVLSRWKRPVPPLDQDIESWIAMQRHSLLADDPEDLSRRLGLSAGDELRLDRLWRERMKDPAIAARAQAALDGPLLPLPRPAVAPLVFPPNTVPSPDKKEPA
jgi:hypothetical protein